MRMRAPRRDPRTSQRTPTSIREEQIMVRYFYAWIPVVTVGTLVILSLPWLGLIALIVVTALVLGALAALALAIVAVVYSLGGAISRRRHGAHAQLHASPTRLRI